MFTDRARTLCVSLALSLLLAACGGGSGQAPEASPSGAAPPGPGGTPSCTGSCSPTAQSHTAFGINGDGTVSVFPVDTATGALGTMTYIAAGTSPTGVVLHPSGNFLYVTNGGDNTLSAFAIDTVSGSLTAIATVATGTGPSSLAVSPSGTALWVANRQANSIDTFAVDAATGTVTHVASYPYSPTPTGITVDAAGRNLYVSSADAYSVWHFAVDPATATLSGGTPTYAPFPSFMSPHSFVIHPNGTFAYGFNLGDYTTVRYGINTSTAALTVTGVTGGSGMYPVWGAVHPSGKHLLTAHGDLVWSWDIEPSTGDITLTVAGAWLGTPIVNVTIDPGGGFAYTNSTADNTIRLLAIDPVTGALSVPSSGASTPTRTGPKALVIRRPP